MNVPNGLKAHALSLLIFVSSLRERVMMGEEMTGNEPGPPVFPPPSIESEGREGVAAYMGGTTGAR